MNPSNSSLFLKIKKYGLTAYGKILRQTHSTNSAIPKIPRRKKQAISIKHFSLQL